MLKPDAKPGSAEKRAQVLAGSSPSLARHSRSLRLGVMTRDGSPRQPAERYVRSRSTPMPAQIARMVQLYGLGLSLRDVGKLVGRDPATVMGHLRRAGVERRPRIQSVPRRPDVVAEDVRRLYDGGLAPQELAVLYDTSLGTILGRLRDAGATTRKPGRPRRSEPAMGPTRSREWSTLPGRQETPDRPWVIHVDGEFFGDFRS